MSMDSLNPLVSTRGKPMHVSWKYLVENKEYNFELIMPFHAPVIRYKLVGRYLCLCITVIADQKTIGSEFLKDQQAMVDIPVKTFERVWMGINHIFRDQIKEEDNILLKFKKLSKQDIILLSYERREPSQKQIDFANKWYKEQREVIARINESKKTIVRKGEEL